MTTQGVMIGTPDYMAPEQAELEGVDQRADIYALGIILFEMVTGRVPFVGKTPLSVAMKHKNQTPPDPRDFNVQVPDSLSRMILRCLAKEKNQRYQSVEELIADLKNIEEGLPTTQKIVPKAKPQPSDEITVTFNKNKLLLPVVVILALVLVFVVLQIIPKKETEITSQRISDLVKPPAPPEIKTGRANVAAKKTMPSLKSLIPTDIEKFIDPANFRGEMQWLGRAFSILSPEAMKHIDEKDLEGFENFLITIRNKLPEDGSYRSAIDQVRRKLQEGKKLQDEGNQEEAEKSYMESQSQMRTLLDSVRQKEGADRAKDSMEQARLYVYQRLSTEKDNLLFAVAEKQVKVAADSYEKSDFAGAKTLYGVLEKIFTLSVQDRDDARSVEILKNFVAGLRTEVNIAGIPASASWLYDRGREEEERANLEMEKEDYNTAAETYIQAAFLYEKVQEEVAKNRNSRRR
jgi:hypothetical protein